jgi:hypothetical protein
MAHPVTFLFYDTFVSFFHFKDKDGNIVAVLLLEDTEETRKIWNYKYV